MLVGPSLDFVSYIALINESGYAVSNVPEKGSRRRIPKGRKRVAYMNLLYGASYLFLYIIGIRQFNYGVILEEWFCSTPLWFRFGLQIVVILYTHFNLFL